MQNLGEMPLLIKYLLPHEDSRNARGEIVEAATERFGYADLNQRISKMANALASLGIEAGETVAVLDWDSARYLECYFAIPGMGCTLQTVNVRLSPEQVRYTIQHAGASTAIVHPDFLPIVVDGWENANPLKRIIPIGADCDLPPCTVPFAPDLATLCNDASTGFAFRDFDERTTATRFYTSGTTGLPKAVHYSHRQIVLHTLGTLATLGTAPIQGRFHADDVYMPMTPLFHAHAWGMPYAATLLGTKQVYPGRYVPANLLRLIRDEGVTFSHCVASILQMLLDDPLSDEIDLSRMKMLIGGGPLPNGLARRALDRGIDVFTGYGMSETGPIQTVNLLTRSELEADRDDQVRLRTRAGRPALLCEVRTMNAACAPTPEGTDGEVMFRSPWLTEGYAGDEAGSARLWEGGWLRSGDIGVFGEDGALRITDRLKDVIKSGGEWISSQDLEGLISTVHGVSEVAVIGIPDERWGERPMALIVSSQGPAVVDAVRQSLIAAADEGVISRYAIPEKIVTVEKLARTSVGKLDKKALRSRYATDTT